MRRIRRAIVTGPTGVVGMSLIEELLKAGIDVTAIVRADSKRKDVLNRFSSVNIQECSLEDISKLQNLLEGQTYDAFFHFAWDGTYGESRNDVFSQEKNVGYTLEAINQAKLLGCSVFVGAGSQSEFGHVDGILSPHLKCEPDNGYGIAKWTAGHLGKILAQKINIDFIWCRIVSMYGPYDGTHTMIMGSIIKMLKGEHCSFTKGDQIWDYIYSKDAAKAFRLVAEKGKNGEIYCIGTGKTKPLKEYIQIMRNQIDRNIEVGFGEIDYYPNQVMHLEADISNLCEDTGFSTKYSYEEGIKETINWAREKYL